MDWEENGSELSQGVPGLWGWRQEEEVAVGRVEQDRSAEYQCHGTENAFGSDGTGNSWTGNCVREKGAQRCGAVGSDETGIDGSETGTETEVGTGTETGT